jgi:hypothetical protein
MPPKQQGKVASQGKPKKPPASSTRIKPNTVPIGLSVGRDIPLSDYVASQKEAYFQRALQRNKRFAYDRDWGDTIVDQVLARDPGPINSGSFKPVKRWVDMYRTAEGGLDGTYYLTVGEARTALAGSGTSTFSSFIIKELHIWLAPNTVSTHFSGILFTQDDPDNGILAGEYSDIAPYGEFVRFRVRFPGEGFICSVTDTTGKKIVGIGGSAKWNGVIYGCVETYD